MKCVKNNCLHGFGGLLRAGTEPEKIVEGGEKRTVSNDIDQQLLTSTIRLI
jgi:hypothetical protein